MQVHRIVNRKQDFLPVSPSNLDKAATDRQAADSQLRQGGLCPICQVERLDYDGLLNLACPQCGVLSAGCFT